MTSMVCSVELHEQLKVQPSWWRAQHLDLLKYFEKRTLDAAVARFDEVCAAAVPPLVAVDQVDEQLEPTVVIFAPNPWAEAQP